MKKRQNFLFGLLLVCVFLVLTSSCEKDDSSSLGNSTNGNFNPAVNYGTMTDQDGNVYKTVTIDTQTWMAENLRTTKYNDGTPIPHVSGNSNWAVLKATDKAYCWYNDDSTTYANTYGALYTWAASMNEAAIVTTNLSGVQGVCPIGWHLPSDTEWTQLFTYLGGESVAGGKLKDTGTAWYSPNTGATNETGFKALPVGGRGNDGTFNYVGFGGYWWSTKENSVTNAGYRRMFYNRSRVDSYNFYKEAGFSVRCVRD